MPIQRIVAIGGGGFSMEPENPLLDAFVLSRARRWPPRICFVPTASGDADAHIARFYRAFAPMPCTPSDLLLFERAVPDLREHVLRQDVVYVGGGSTVNLLAVWRAHGLDRILAEAWAEGIVLCGVSAGMNCWFEESVTDSFDVTRLAPLHDGMALLAGSACPHYDGESERRPSFHRLVGTGELRDGWAADDGAALVFDGEELDEVVASRPSASAYRVSRTDGGVHEERVPARFLGIE
jgi:peptidase E